MNNSAFIDFISKSNIYSTAIGFLITTQVIGLVNALFDNMIAPIINYLINKNNDKKLKEYIIERDGINIEIGAFFLAICKFLFILMLVYLFIIRFNVQIKEA
jgi:large-conductance mechanosensitive channel